MSFKKYTDYFKYVIEHKKNVFTECMNMSKKYKGKEKRELIIHAFTHDLSKFLANKEFYAYADWFYGEYGTKYKGEFSDKHEMCKQRFENAWQHHYLNNKHHWNYWKDYDYNMPTKYIRQMICDWRGMSRKFGDMAESFYLKNYNKIHLSHDSRLYLEHQLDIIAPGAYTCECDSDCWMTLKELLKDDLDWENENKQDSRWLRKEAIPWYKEKYNFDIFELLK